MEGKSFANFEGHEDVIEKIKEFVNSKEFLRLILVGPVGTGKTHLAYGAIRYAYHNGLGAIFIPSEDLELVLRDKFMSWDKEKVESSDRMINTIMDLGIVVIDDLGEEYDPDSYARGLKWFLDKYKGKIIITTNLNSEDIARRFGEKVLSRIVEKSVIISTAGWPDYRMKELTEAR